LIWIDLIFTPKTRERGLETERGTGQKLLKENYNSSGKIKDNGKGKVKNWEGKKKK
jgi:hypothetical protein